MRLDKLKWEPFCYTYTQ